MVAPLPFAVHRDAVLLAGGHHVVVQRGRADVRRRAGRGEADLDADADRSRRSAGCRRRLRPCCSDTTRLAPTRTVTPVERLVAHVRRPVALDGEPADASPASSCGWCRPARRRPRPSDRGRSRRPTSQGSEVRRSSPTRPGHHRERHDWRLGSVPRTRCERWRPAHRPGQRPRHHRVRRLLAHGPGPVRRPGRPAAEHQPGHGDRPDLRRQPEALPAAATTASPTPASAARSTASQADLARTKAIQPGQHSTGHTP